MNASNQSDHILSILKSTFGFEAFRSGQQQTVSQLLQGHSSLAIFPTGSGKSLCYQLTALQLPHLTLVVSPLLALMKDQLTFIQGLGIGAASIDSTQSGDDARRVMQDVRSGACKILMVSVERFKNERFRQFIQSVLVSMLVVDEAHCISEWGHNFRPDYIKLPQYRNELNPNSPDKPLVLLLTATATRKVKLDMATRFAIQPQHIVQTGFYRSNLDLSVVAVQENDKRAQLLVHIQQQALANEIGSGIVYVTLQHSAELVANWLQSQGINAKAYHAGLADDKRQKIQQDFMAGQIKVVVATIAFGMGIDKSDIRFVIHYDLPKSIENYCQEIGRAGRDGHLSKCITLANFDGLNTLENFVYGDTPEREGIAQLLQAIVSESQDGKWEVQIVGLADQCNIRQLPLKTLLVRLEMLGAIRPMFTYFAEFKYKMLAAPEDILTKFDGERRDFLAAIFEHTQMKKVWGELDFDSLYQQYSGQASKTPDRSRVITAMEYLQEKGLVEIASKRLTDVYQADVDIVRRAGLADELYQYFADKEDVEIKRIAALVRFFELDRCLSQNLAGYFDDANAPQQCGHCSVCRGQVAKLSYSYQFIMPDDATLREAIAGLQQKLTGQLQLSHQLVCRFLAGMNVPVFSRNKVRQLPGFGICEQHRYSDISAAVERLMGNER